MDEPHIMRRTDREIEERPQLRLGTVRAHLGLAQLRIMLIVREKDDHVTAEGHASHQCGSA